MVISGGDLTKKKIKMVVSHHFIQDGYSHSQWAQIANIWKLAKNVIFCILWSKYVI